MTPQLRDGKALDDLLDLLDADEGGARRFGLRYDVRVEGGVGRVEDVGERTRDGGKGGGKSTRDDDGELDEVTNGKMSFFEAV
jgi:hypothetical protein